MGQYNVTLSDFSKTQRTILVNSLATGLVSDLDSLSDAQFSKEDLIKLTRAEVPALRALAFIQLFKRKDVEQFPLLMDHLDDTAYVMHDHGHYGYSFEAVTEIILDEAVWETAALRDSTLVALLRQPYHYPNTFYALEYAPPFQGFHDTIRRMVLEPRVIVRSMHEDEVYLQEQALFGLANFGRDSDKVFIRNWMEDRVRKLSQVSLKLIRNYPDTIYMDILEKYHYMKFYRTLNYEKEGFTGYHYENVDAHDFISAVGAQKSLRAAVLLDSMMLTIPRLKWVRQPDMLMSDIVELFYDSDVPEYQFLKTKYRKWVKKRKKQIRQFAEITEYFNDVVSQFEQQKDTVTEKPKYYWRRWND